MVLVESEAEAGRGQQERRGGDCEAREEAWHQEEVEKTEKSFL